MKPTANPILIGIIAGLAAAVLMAASGYVPFAAFLLFSGAYVAIFYAGLGHGLMSGLVAIAVTALAIGGLDGSTTGAFFTLVQLLPILIMSHLANLGRPAAEIGGPDTATAWFPLSDVLLAGAGAAAISTIITLFFHPNMEALYAAVAEAAAKMMAEMNPDAPVPTGMVERIHDILRIMGPLVQSAQLMLALFVGYYFATRILVRTGRSTRPREHMPTSLRMNRLAIAVFLAGIALMFAGDRIEIIGASFAGAVAAGFLLAGFAVIHAALSGKTWATPGLVLIYLATFIVPVIGFAIILAGGLANPRRAIALTQNTPQQSNDNQSN